MSCSFLENHFQLLLSHCGLVKTNSAESTFQTVNTCDISVHIAGKKLLLYANINIITQWPF